jgi:multidrug resistance efflux pump
MMMYQPSSPARTGHPAAASDEQPTDLRPSSAPRVREGTGRIARLLVGGACLFILALVTVRALDGYMAESAWVTTDDAVISADIVPLSSGTAGHVTAVKVRNDQHVRAGQLLIMLDDGRASEGLKQARAALSAARARRRPDAIAEARNAVSKAEMAVRATKVYAPRNGRVEHVVVSPGMNVQAGQPLLALVPDRLYVIANFKETTLHRIHPGQSVDIAIDAYPGTPFPGHVTSIQAGTGTAFNLLPAENASGNYVKVVQRVPVRIDFDGRLPRVYALGPGMSVEPRVHVP